MSKQLHQFLEQQLSPPKYNAKITVVPSKNDLKESRSDYNV